MNIDVKEQVVKNGFWNVMAGLINRAGSFIFIALLSRWLLPDGFGKYSLALTVATFFVIFSDIGINQTLIRYVSLEFSQPGTESISHFKYLFKVKLTITIIFSIALFVLAYPLSHYLFSDPDLFYPLLILSVYVFFISLVGFLESLFFIKKNVKYISLKESVHVLLKILAVFLIATFVAQELRIFSIFLSFVIIAIVLFFVVLHFSKKAYSFLYQKAEPPKDKKQIWKFMLLLGIQNFSLTFISMATVILLGIFLEDKFVGYYSTSWALVTSISTLLFSFSYVLLPIYTSVDEIKFEEILKKTFRILLLLALPISFGLSLLSRYFIVLIHGYEYLPAANALSLLAFSIPFVLITDLALTSFSARSKQKRFSKTLFIIAIIFLILNLAFIKLFLNVSSESVVTGVAMANLFSWMLCSASSLLLIKKEFKIKIISLWILKPLLACLVMTACIMFMLTIFADINLFNGIVIILTGAFTYFITLLITKGITIPELKNLVSTLLRSKKN